jgi:uracil-DNA glycosylase
VKAIAKKSVVADGKLTVLQEIQAEIVACRQCERLRAYCENLGVVKRRAYIDQTYWAKPVPGFGDPKARILIIGLAPGAHGANRTGRPFTGDGAGNFMYPVLHEVGLANHGNAVSREDGLKIAFDGYLAHLLAAGVIERRSAYKFGHGAEYLLPNGLHLLAAYHPSLRNTNTGRMDKVMFARIFVRARELAGLD